MGGLLLHPQSGKPTVESEIKRLEAMARAPDHVLEQLEFARQYSGPWEPRGSLNSWQETLFASIATETALTAASEAYLFPLIYGAIPAGYMQPHRTLHLRVYGQTSLAGTPGTFTERIKWQSPADAATAGVTLAASAAVTMAATQTNISWVGEYYVTCRTEGTAGTFLSSGMFESAAVPTPFMFMMPASAPATVSVDTTIAKNLALTHTPSLGTASIAGFQYTFSSLN